MVAVEALPLLVVWGTVVVEVHSPLPIDLGGEKGPADNITNYLANTT